VIVFAPVPGSPFDGRLDGPVWDGSALLVCRVDGNEILRFDPATGSTTRLRHSTSGTRGLAIDREGRLYGAQTKSRRVVWYEAGGATSYLEAMLDGRRHNDPQDLALDREGRIWFSDDWTPDSVGGPVGWPPLGHQSVLRLTRVAATADGIGDWRLERMTTDTIAPAGVTIAADDRTLFVIDRGDRETSPTLRAYPINADGLGAASVLHAFTPDPDPDRRPTGPGGLAIDPDGRLLVAVGPGLDPDGPGLVAFDAAGGRIGHHPLPGRQPTSCAVGGPDGRTLFVTTAEGDLLAATF
jgi:gluconolactonase